MVKTTEVDNYLLFKYKTQDLLEIKYIPQEKQSENIDFVETYMLSNNSRLQDNNIIKKVIDGAYENFNDKKPEPLKEYNLEDIYYHKQYKEGKKPLYRISVHTLKHY